MRAVRISASTRGVSPTALVRQERDYSALPPMPDTFVGYPCPQEHRATSWRYQWFSICVSPDPAQAFINHNAGLAEAYRIAIEQAPESDCDSSSSSDDRAERARQHRNAAKARSRQRLKADVAKLRNNNIERNATIHSKLQAADVDDFVEENNLTTLQAIRLFTTWIKLKRADLRRQRRAKQKRHAHSENE